MYYIWTSTYANNTKAQIDYVFINKKWNNRNTKVKARSPDGDTDYFDIVACVLQGDTLASYRFIICLDYMLRTSIDQIKENGFKLTKERSKGTP